VSHPVLQPATHSPLASVAPAPSPPGAPPMMPPLTPAPTSNAAIDPLVGGKQQPLPIMDPSPPVCRRLLPPSSAAQILVGGVPGRRGYGCPVRSGVHPPSWWIHPRPSRPRPRLSAPIRARRAAPVSTPPSVAARASFAHLRSRPPARRSRVPPPVCGRPRIRARLRPSTTVRLPVAAGRRLFIAHCGLITGALMTTTPSSVASSAALLGAMAVAPAPVIPLQPGAPPATAAPTPSSSP